MRFLAKESILVMIDIQERLLPHIHNHLDLLKHCQIIIKGFHQLSIPILVTEQYKKGLGETVGVLNKLVESEDRIEKMTFSCCDDKSFMSLLKKYKRKQVILFGIEAHVCVLQTALDLLEAGYTVAVVEDCVSSRKLSDKQTAVSRLKQEGINITSYESILLELCRVSGTTQFRAISKLIK